MGHLFYFKVSIGLSLNPKYVTENHNDLPDALFGGTKVVVTEASGGDVSRLLATISIHDHH